MKKLGIKTKTVFSSELHITEKGSDRILQICKALNSDTYIAGASGKNYLNLEDFKKNKIQVLFQNFQHPVYKQVYEPFLPNMSVVDLLFNEGKNSLNILRNAKNY